MSLLSMVREKLRGRFGKNVLAMYVQHGGSILLPLINLPYLARVLTPSSWGTVLFAQAYALYLTIFIQYGFNTAASREIARSQATGDGLATFVSEVMGAKLLLTVIALLVSLVLWRYVGPFHQSPRVFWCAVAWGVFQGLFYTWYFQGIEKLHFISLIEVGTRALAVAATFLFVHKPADNWIVMLLLAGSSFLTFAAGAFMVYQDVPLVIPSIAGSVKALRLSWHRFLFELASTLYTTSGTLFVGLFAAERVVAFYNNADRLTRTIRVSLDPVMRAAFPRISSLTATRMEEATVFARRLFIILGGASIVMGLAAFALAPLAVHIVFGDAYRPIVPILRILSPVIPMYVITTVLGFVWAYPLGFDKEVTRVMMIAAAVNAVLAVVFVPVFGGIGMAVAALIVNFYVLWAHVRMLQRASLFPIKRKWLLEMWTLRRRAIGLRRRQGEFQSPTRVPVPEGVSPAVSEGSMV